MKLSRRCLVWGVWYDGIFGFIHALFCTWLEVYSTSNSASQNKNFSTQLAIPVLLHVIVLSIKKHSGLTSQLWEAAHVTAGNAQTLILSKAPISPNDEVRVILFKVFPTRVTPLLRHHPHQKSKCLSHRNATQPDWLPLLASSLASGPTPSLTSKRLEFPSPRAFKSTTKSLYQQQTLDKALEPQVLQFSRRSSKNNKYGGPSTVRELQWVCCDCPSLPRFRKDCDFGPGADKHTQTGWEFSQHWRTHMPLLQLARVRISTGTCCHTNAMRIELMKALQCLRSWTARCDPYLPCNDCGDEDYWKVDRWVCLTRGNLLVWTWYW